MKKALGVFAFALLAVFLLPVLITPPSRTSPEGDRAEAMARQIEDAVTKHYQEYADWPPGEHANTIKALRGENPKGIVFFTVGDESVNADGELPDPWGTPYRISIDHETHRVNVISAGPDHVFQHANSRHSDDVRGQAAGGVPGLPF